MKHQQLFKLLKLFTACSALLLIGAMSGCSDSSGGGGNNPTATQAITTPSADGNIQAKIGGVTINSPPVVTFALSDEKGQPLDPVSLINSGGAIRFFIARISADGSKYDSYIPVNDPANANFLKVPSYDGNEDLTTAAGAAGVATYSGRFATVSPGVYTYTFKTDVKDTTKTFNALAFDQTLTHTVVAQISRNVLVNNKTVQQASNPYINFRPDGGTIVNTREIVSISACNECHVKLGVHGGGRREIMLCLMCHNSNVTDASMTGNPINLMSMIHKIHMGAQRPSGKVAGTRITYGVSSSDFSKVGYPMFSNDPKISGTPIDCVKCHKAGTDTFGNPFGKDVGRWNSQPNMANCTSCHDLTAFDPAKTSITFNIFTTGQKAPITRTTTGTLHLGGPQDDSKCAGCHTPTGKDYDAISVPGVHTVYEKAATAWPGLVTKVLGVSNLGYALPPAITFQVTDKNGKAYAFKNTSTAISIRATIQKKGIPDVENIPEPTANVRAFGNFTTLFSGVSGASTSISITSGTATSALGAGQLTTVDATKGIYKVDLATYIAGSGGKVRVLPTRGVTPGGASNGGYYNTGAIVQFGVQAVRNDAKVTHRFKTPIVAPIGAVVIPAYFDLDSGSAVAPTRRQTVDNTKCNKCHGNLLGGVTDPDTLAATPGFHGGERQAVEYCVVCHTPNNLGGGQAGDFKVFVHKIHRGTALADKTYTFAGALARGGYPNDLRNCIACHTTANPAVTDTTPTLLVGNAVTPVNSANRLNSWAAVCTSCHDGTKAGGTVLTNPVGHAAQNAYTYSTLQDNNTCSTCHAPDIRAIDHTPAR